MSDCRFCDQPIDAGEREPGDEPEVCGFCYDLLDEGRSARGRMAPMEACPWYRGDPRAANVLGDPDYHDVGPLRCPWCAGWGEAERELFNALRAGAKR